MAPKKAKGKAISLAEFQGDAKPAGDNYDWVEDEWTPEPTEEIDQVEVDKRKAYMNLRYKHDATKLGTELGFRDAPVNRLNTMVADDMPPPYTVYIGNLAIGTTEKDMLDVFAASTIERVKIVTKEQKGVFAFVEFKTLEALRFAIIRNGEIVKKRAMKISVATPEQMDRMSRNNNNNKKDSSEALDREAFGGREAFGAKEAFGGRDAFGGRMRSSNSLSDLPLSAWRDAPQESQPSAFGGRGDFGNEQRRPRRSEPTAQSTTESADAFTSWRDAPQQQQPASPNVTEGARRFERGGTGGGNARPDSGRAPTRVLAKPSVPADNSSRWGELLK